MHMTDYWRNGDKKMSFTPNSLKAYLNFAIRKAVSIYKKDYATQKDFKRKRALPMDTVIRLLLFMQGGSLKKELYDAGVTASASAFVQQRNKIPWTVFEDILEQFNFYCKDQKKYKGYQKEDKHLFIPHSLCRIFIWKQKFS